MTIIFQVTYNCNLRCSYCYQPKTNHKVLAFDDAKVFINELFKFIKTKKSPEKQEENGAAVAFLQKILQSGLHSREKSDTIALPGKSRENF